VIGGAMTGGIGLAASAPSLIMRTASTGMAMGQMAAADAQIEETMAKAEAARMASRIVPDGDRPAEAQALLSIIDGPNGKSASWRNPDTGASGRITVRHTNTSAGMTCRIVEQEWKTGAESRKGSMAICRQDGRWYDLS
jgi:surface antigen